MNNKELLRHFAHTPHQEVKANSLSVSFNTLYSYSTPIAFFQENTGYFIVTTRKYSRTTSLHQSALLSTLEAEGCIIIPTEEHLP